MNLFTILLSLVEKELWPCVKTNLILVNNNEMQLISEKIVSIPLTLAAKFKYGKWQLSSISLSSFH